MEPTTPTPPARPSLGRAFEQTIEHTQRMLFQPFVFTRWLAVGLGAFLAGLGGQGGFNCNINIGPQGSFTQALQEIADLLGLGSTGLAIAGLVLLAVVVVAAVLFLRSRGEFMFVDQVANSSDAVALPWATHAPLANQLLAWYGLLVVVAAAGVAVVGLLMSQLSGQPGAQGLLVAAGVLGGLVLLVVFFATQDLLVPVMYATRAGVAEGWAIAWQRVVAAYPGTVALYVLFKVVLMIAFGIISGIAMCLTCGLALLPYVSSVVLLPVLVVLRAFPMKLLEQMDPAFAFFVEPPREPICEGCGYDLRGSRGQSACPECGQPFKDTDFDWQTAS